MYYPSQDRWSVRNRRICSHPCPLARCPARGKGQVQQGRPCRFSAPLTTTLGSDFGLARIRWHAVHVRLGRYCTLLDHARKRNLSSTVRGRKLRHDESAQTDTSALTVADEPCGSCTDQRKSVRLSFLHLAAPWFAPLLSLPDPLTLAVGGACV